MSALGNPWRPENWSERETMLQTLREFKANQRVEHLRILCVGPAGAGKSTFITSVNTVVQGRNTYLAHSLSDDTSVTCQYTVYKMNKGTDGSSFPFVFGDMMGLQQVPGGVRTNDIISILKGHMQEEYTFNPLKDLTAESNYFNKNPNLEDKIHCLVFVLPGDNIFILSPEVKNKMKQILQETQKLRIPVAVILTKVDVTSPLVQKNLKMIYRSKRIKERMKECNRILGIPLNYIFPVKNYHEEINNNDEIDILILTAMTNIVNFANDFVTRKV
ncbi:interferon-induced protein 44-like isoform X2 [Hemibagrus wyckioides]|uniref:interferon-induced protein 44-like isoform X2 n=1 Tax=Hemibagrus wyckioides TaxID=337641 RepID=UPI00266CC34C|nr:interferon-induced protein 44-like isoform X2 [Hemibagrus wyckioides]XP_058235961.1 interferon-induced protein 44-like isoform X2 [Hemibagrus wyckioides]